MSCYCGLMVSDLYCTCSPPREKTVRGQRPILVEIDEIQDWVSNSMTDYLIVEML